MMSSMKWILNLSEEFKLENAYIRSTRLYFIKINWVTLMTGVIKVTSINIVFMMIFWYFDALMSLPATCPPLDVVGLQPSELWFFTWKTFFFKFIYIFIRWLMNIDELAAGAMGAQWLQGIVGN